jgi:hypothetical protein
MDIMVATENFSDHVIINLAYCNSGGPTDALLRTIYKCCTSVRR